MKRGFTLLEIIAAVTLLSIVAVAIIPITLRLGHGSLSLQTSYEAQRWLLEQLKLDVGPDDVVLPIEKHDGWFLHRQYFIQTSPPRVDHGMGPPAHKWVHLTVRNGAHADAEILADRLILIPIKVNVETQRPAVATP